MPLIIEIRNHRKVIGYFGHWKESGAPHLFPFAHQACTYSDRRMAERYRKWVETMGRHTGQISRNAKAKIVNQ